MRSARPRLVVLILVAAGAALGAWPLRAQEGGRVEGVVRADDAGRALALAFATVELWGEGGRTFAGSTDEAGRYRFDGVPPGRYRLRVTHIGYRTWSTQVQVGAQGLRLDVSLEVHPVRMPEVEVRGSPTPVPVAGDSARSVVEPDLAMRMLERGSGLASSGLLDAVNGLPGRPPPDERDALLLRGAALDLKSVELDGAPVYTPFHVGGLIPSFDDWLVGRGSVWVGAAPAEYDGGLNYILDLRTRTPDREARHASVGADLLGIRAGLTTPLTRHGALLVGGRGLHDGLGRVTGRGASPFGYRDVLGRLDLDLGAGVSLRATGFWNREDVALEYPNTQAGTRLPGRAEWGNTAASVETGVGVGERGGALLISGAYGRYDAGLPLGGTLPAYASGSTARTEGGIRAVWPWGAGATLRVGSEVERVDGTYTARGLDESGATRLFTQTGETWIWSGHADLHRPLGSSASLRAGVRASRLAEGGVQFGPRLGVAFSLSEEAVLAVSAGRYHQVVTGADRQVPAGLSETLDEEQSPAVGGALFGLAAANHLVVSLDQMVTARTRLGLDGYYKRFDGLGIGLDEGLSSSGVDLRVMRSGERFRAWVGYSLSWQWTGASGQSDRFTGRQLLSTGVSGTLASWSGLDVSLSYGDGLPLTAIAETSEAALDGSAVPPSPPIVIPDRATTAIGAAREDPALTGGPSGDFLRLDLEVHGWFPQRWGGREHVLKPYIKLLNALDRRDALFYYFEPWRPEELRPLAELSVLPVLGLEWRF